MKGSFVFPSITFFIELIIKCSKLKDKLVDASINCDLDQRYMAKPWRENDSLLCLVVAKKKKPNEWLIRRKPPLRNLSIIRRNQPCLLREEINVVLIYLF
jgi:hypothetical protein